MPTAPARRFGFRAPAVPPTLFVLMLAACSVAPVKHTDVEQTLPDRVAPIVVGETSRAQVREMLGEPQLSSEYWHFDLFRFSGRNIAAVLLYIVPVSVTQDVDALALVVYDTDGKVVAYDKGSTRAVPGWGEHDPPARLQAAGLTVVTQVGRTTSIYVTAARRDAYLAGNTSHGQCTVLAACDGGSQCFTTWTVDGQAQPPLTWIPPAVATTRSSPKPPPYPVHAWLTPFLIAPGEHPVAAIDKGKAVANAALNCAGGETMYVLVDRPIQMFREAPAALASLPMVIYRDGWLVSREPGRE